MKKQGGFTIIEILVVVAIVSVLLTVAISNFNQIRLQFSLSRAAYKFDQDLRKAQNFAMSSGQYQYDEIVAGYGIKIDINNFGRKKYIIYADKITNLTNCNTNKTNCSDVGPCIGNEKNDESDYLIETIDFSKDESGIIIKEVNLGGTSVSNASINFNSCNLLVRANMTSPEAQSSDEMEIVFSFESDTNQTRTVYLNRAGLIKIK